MTRDASDIQKIMEKLTTFSPFNQEPSLRNIITGVNATECVNVHELFTEGESIVRQMEDQPVFEYLLIPVNTCRRRRSPCKRGSPMLALPSTSECTSGFGGLLFPSGVDSAGDG